MDFSLAPRIVNKILPAVLPVVIPNHGVLTPKYLLHSKLLNVPPTINWPGDSNTFYTLCLINNQNKCINWLVGNITDSDISKGETLLEYMNLAESKGSLLTCYFYLYKQPKKLTFDQKRLTKTSEDITLERQFCMREFAKKYNLGDPIASNTYLTFNVEVQKIMSNPLPIPSFLFKCKSNRRIFKK